MQNNLDKKGKPITYFDMAQYYKWVFIWGVDIIDQKEKKAEQISRKRTGSQGGQSQS